ncbi:hypothetical protein NUW54_g13489 [Trametes sanguinea]|uniref:Uncharacterized protein n=1 Tax=Trametes sanguinea TaxID=158606 RepID=A0ACC1MKF2_9APHY|nr:hypothetical protein NUW54_g13489 [Trametes sanguinea]
MAKVVHGEPEDGAGGGCVFHVSMRVRVALAAPARGGLRLLAQTEHNRVSLDAAIKLDTDTSPFSQRSVRRPDSRDRLVTRANERTAELETIRKKLNRDTLVNGHEFKPPSSPSSKHDLAVSRDEITGLKLTYCAGAHARHFRAACLVVRIANHADFSSGPGYEYDRSAMLHSPPDSDTSSAEPTLSHLL